MTTPADQPDLIAWLRAQLDEDVATFDALDSTALNGIESTAGWDAREYIERGRAEVDAKRRILARCEQAYREQGIYGEDGQEQVAEDMLGLLALPYADRPGYREEWRP